MRRFSCLLLVVGVVALGCCGLVAFGMYLVAQEEGAVKDAYGETAAALCDPAPAGTANRSNAPTGMPLAALVMRNGQISRHPFHEQLPEDLRADDQAELDVVICMSTREQEVENCEYTATGTNNEETEFVIRRVQKIDEAVILNAADGTRIAEVSIPGGSPAQCPETYTATEGSTTTNTGADVTYAEFLEAVEPYLRGQ